MSFERFREMAASGGLVPVWHDLLLDTDTPVSAFAKLRRGPFAFLLESAPAGGETWSRYTFMGTEPRAAWRLRDGVAESWTATEGWHSSRRPDDPLADLEAVVTEHRAIDVPELGAFWGGAIGYFDFAGNLYQKLFPYASGFCVFVGGFEEVLAGFTVDPLSN